MTSTLTPPVFIGGQIDDATPQPTDGQFWSVTTIIGCLDKPALVPWAAKATAEAAIDNAATVRALAETDGRDEAVRYLTGARFRRPKGAVRSATALGTAVHEACESYVLTGQRPDVDDEVRPFLYQFERFLDDFAPEFEAAEVTVFHPGWGYAGTLDSVFRIGRERLICDIKTSRESWDATGKPRTPYPEVALQLAAYRYAEAAAVWRARRFEKFRRRYYLASDAELAEAVPVPEVDGGVALLLMPDRYGLYDIECGPDVHECFGHVCEAARWSFEVARSVVGEARAPKRRRPPADPFEGLPQ